MNVGELIASMKDIPLDARVFVADWNEQCRPPILLTSVRYDSDVNVVTLEDE